VADLVGYNGERKEFKYVGVNKLFPGKLSFNLATGKAKHRKSFPVQHLLSLAGNEKPETENAQETR
jgi:hypothetical protein